jgi:cytochrome c oxidase subunit IV
MGHDHKHNHDDHGHGHDHGHGEKGHASVKLYWVFCVILCCITGLEWAIFKSKDSLGLTNGVMVPLMLALSFIKFTMVVGWYMHLRFDHNWVKFIFVAALGMGGATGIALCILM